MIPISDVRARLIALVALIALPVVLIAWTALNLVAIGQNRALIKETQAQIARFEGRVADARSPLDVSPVFVNAGSRSLAEAELQRQVVAIVETAPANLIESSAADLGAADDAAIAVRATFDASNDALLTLLRRIEGGLPLMFVDEISVRRLQSSADETLLEPVLRIEMRVRGQYRNVVS